MQDWINHAWDTSMALGSFNSGDFATSFPQLYSSHETSLSLKIITKYLIYIFRLSIFTPLFKRNAKVTATRKFEVVAERYLRTVYL